MSGGPTHAHGIAAGPRSGRPGTDLAVRRSATTTRPRRPVPPSRAAQRMWRIHPKRSACRRVGQRAIPVRRRRRISVALIDTIECRGDWAVRLWGTAGHQQDGDPKRGSDPLRPSLLHLRVTRGIVAPRLPGCNRHDCHRPHRQPNRRPPAATGLLSDDDRIWRARGGTGRRGGGSSSGSGMIGSGGCSGCCGSAGAGLSDCMTG